MLMILVTIVHVVMCLMLIAIVLLQTGKGADMGAAFGGASQTLFGGAGPANFLNKVTTAAAIVFMFTSLSLAIISSKGDASSKVLEAAPVQQTQSAVNTPTPTETSQTQPSAETTNAPAGETTPAPEATPTK